MAFPFTINFERRLRTEITADNKDFILKNVKNSILKAKADKVVLDQMTVKYRGSTSSRRASLFGSPDSGAFALIYNKDYWILSHQINIHKLFIWTLIMSTAMGVFMLIDGGPWWVGFPTFAWLYGGNYVIIYLRHGLFITDMANDIDKPSFDKITLTEQDKMTGKLKSWF